MHLIKLIIILLLTGSTINTFGQYSLKGVVSDEAGTPIPAAKVFVKNSADLRSIADENGQYEMRLYQGEYFLVITSMGYKTIETDFINMSPGDSINVDFYLATDDRPIIHCDN